MPSSDSRVRIMVTPVFMTPSMTIAVLSEWPQERISYATLSSFPYRKNSGQSSASVTPCPKGRPERIMATVAKDS